jgi:hypothetical protein
MKCNLYRYTEAAKAVRALIEKLGEYEVGLYKLKSVETHSLKPPGFFNPRAYQVRNRFQAFAFSKRNVHRRYNEECPKEEEDEVKVKEEGKETAAAGGGGGGGGGSNDDGDGGGGGDGERAFAARMKAAELRAATEAWQVQEDGRTAMLDAVDAAHTHYKFNWAQTTVGGALYKM